MKIIPGSNPKTYFNHQIYFFLHPPVHDLKHFSLGGVVEIQALKHNTEFLDFSFEIRRTQNRSER